jgi:plasmid stability protein
MTNNRRREFRVRNIPEELYKQFKIVSVLKGVTVNELFLEVMTEMVKKEKLPDLREK